LESATNFEPRTAIFKLFSDILKIIKFWQMQLSFQHICKPEGMFRICENNLKVSFDLTFVVDSKKARIS